MTREAPFIRSLRLTASIIISMPSLKSALRKAINPAPKPPAAPAPGVLLKDLPSVRVRIAS